jgi:hypothetical protein
MSLASIKETIMTTRFLSTFFGLALAVSAFGMSAAAAEEKSKEKDAAFELKEVSIFDNGNAGQPLWRAMNVQCSTEPFEEVKAYPKLNSKRPLYGKLQLPRTAAKEEAPIYFVLDQSGEQPAVEKKKEEKSAEKKDEKPTSKKKAETRRPATPKPSSYDRLYIDANRDGDLTNDPVIKPMKNPPWNMMPSNMSRFVLVAARQRQRLSPETERMAFELASIDIDYGPGVGVRPFKVLSWFTLSEGQKTPLMRFAAGTARTGTIKIGEAEYEARLTQDVLTGRFDRPTASVQLTPKSHPATRAFLGFESETLMTMRHRDGEFYTLVATPPGDKLTVEMYRGPFGVFKVGPGDRKVKDIGFQGSFYGPKAFLNMGPSRTNPAAKMMTECKLPVGDYPTFNLTIDYGGLQVAIGSYYSQPRRGNKRQSPPQGIQIREDKPFVLDFPNKPEIVFQGPPADKSLKLGSDVRIATILVDPKLGIMVRGLTDPKRTTKETVKYRVGKEEREFTYNKVFSYEPTVTITNSSGKNVAEGVMPFG